MNRLNNISFQAQAHAKCIFAGEHAVLRGCPALILPIPTKVISLTYEPSSQKLIILAKTKYEEVFLNLFWGALKYGTVLSKKNLKDVQGKFEIQNNIEMGAGLGFSAALCVVITRWLIWEHWVNRNKLFSFAHKMEDMFHGKSSGADVAGALADHLVHFEQGNIHEIKMQWVPKLYLSHSGSGKITEDAINKVKLLNQEHPKLAKKIDQKMQESVCLIEKALTSNEKKGFRILVNAIEEAQQCFKKWGLIPPELQAHIDKLYAMGATAVKPTGAGGGGFVLSLWDNPPAHNTKELTPLF